MTPNVYIYTVSLPPMVSEMVVPCLDGYTVYLDSDLDDEERMKAYRHALGHIERDDWSRTDVGQIEKEAHDGKSN